MGKILGLLTIELTVAVPLYYFIRSIMRGKHIHIIALTACIIGISIGWISSYRITIDEMVSEFRETSIQIELTNHRRNLSEEKWFELRNEFIANLKDKKYLYETAAKNTLFSAIFLFILFYWLTTREKINTRIGNADKLPAYSKESINEFISRCAAGNATLNEAFWNFGFLNLLMVYLPATLLVIVVMKIPFFGIIVSGFILLIAVSFSITRDIAIWRCSWRSSAIWKGMLARVVIFVSWVWSAYYFAFILEKY